MEDGGELRGDVAAAHHHHLPGQAVDAHHGVRGVDLGEVHAGDVRQHRAGARGHHHLVSGDLGPGLRPQRPRPGEADVLLVQVNVVQLLGPVPPAALGDGVDPAEDPVADAVPPHLVQASGPRPAAMLPRARRPGPAG